MSFSFFNSLPLKKYLISYLIALLLTLVILSFLSILFTFFPPSDKLLTFACTHSGTLSAFIAAAVCTYRTGKQGLLTGLISADIYTVLLSFAGWIIFGKNLTVVALSKALTFSSIWGMIGGVLGVNFKR